MSVCIENKIHNQLPQYLPIYKTNSKYKLQLITKSAIKKIAYWKGRAKQRKALANLDDHLLADIGYTRADVKKEISKPFWK